MRFRAALVVAAGLLALSFVTSAPAQQSGMGSQMPQTPPTPGQPPMQSGMCPMCSSGMCPMMGGAQGGMMGGGSGWLMLDQELLGLASGSDAPVLASLRQGLRDLGYEEGKNLVIEYRTAEGKYDRLPALAVQLVGLKIDVLVTYGTPGALAAKQATTVSRIFPKNFTDHL